jgi:hypothetical protein
MKPKISNKLLSSYALMRELYDNKKNMKEVISNFILFLLVIKKIKIFSMEDVKEGFCKEFNFDIPISVIKICLNLLKKKNIIKKENKKFILQEKVSLEFDIKKYEELDIKNTFFLENLLIYLQEFDNKLTLENVTQDLCSYLLDREKISQDKIEKISSFLLRNSSNLDLYNTFTKIEEGVLLYSGITYTNMSEIGIWNNKLTIYLDTEVLLDSYNYNGDTYKKQFDEFWQLISEVNKKKKYIELKYFSTKFDEIEKIFDYIDNSFNQNIYLQKEAFLTIKSKCKKREELVIEKARFLRYLTSKNIIKENELQLTEDNYHNNLISEEKISYYITNKQLEREKIETIFNDLNCINLLRKGKKATEVEKSKYILLTRNSKTLSISYEEFQKQESTVLTVNFDTMITILWFKLNKGFGNPENISSLKSISKAQFVLQNMIKRRVKEVMTELQNEDIDKETIEYVIADIKSKESTTLSKIETLCLEDDEIQEIEMYDIERIINEKLRKDEEKNIVEKKLEDSEKDNAILKSELKIFKDKEQKRKNKNKKIIIFICIIIGVIIMCYGYYYKDKYANIYTYIGFIITVFSTFYNDIKSYIKKLKNKISC